MRTITIAEFTMDAFAPYGDLLLTPTTPPRQDRAVTLQNTRPTASANLALIRSEVMDGLMPLRRLERHPHSNQAFLPLSVEAYVVVVAPDCDGRPDEPRIQAFRVPGHAGINYRAGAWHAHMMTLRAPGTFAMLVHEDGSESDCVFAPIEPLILARLVDA